MNFQDFEKLLDQYRSGELPVAQAAQIEAFMFENSEARQAYEADDQLGAMLRSTLTDYPPVAPERLQAVARRAMRQIKRDAAQGSVPAPAARGKVSTTLGLLDWLIAPFRQPQLAAALAGILLFGGVTGWTLRPQVAAEAGKSSATPPAQISDAGISQDVEPAVPEVTTDPGAMIQPASSVIQKSALLENLQSVKFDLMASGNDYQMERLRQFELQLASMTPAAAEPSDAKEQNLALYQRGETALLNGNAAEARVQFAALRVQDKGGMLGFLATIHLANIAFNTGSDYPTALRLYESALNDYPAQYISDQNKVDIQHKIELIARNSADDYRPLRLYQQARQSRPDLARVHFEQLMSLYPNSSVAAEAVDHLLHYALDYPDKNLLPANEALKIFIVFVEKFPESRLVPKVQVAMGDIYLFRYQRTQQALMLYTTALERTSDESLTATVKTRVQFMVDNGMMSD